MDEGFNKAVTRVFVQLYNEGLLYRDKRLVNWDPKFKTAISDLEVETREVQGTFTHIRYPLADGVRLASGADHIIVATTRPETMLGDTAVAVNASDERYQSVIGKFVRLPITGRLIPIVADDHADPELGSGAVKITPAHDFNDFEVGRRHGMVPINILDADARIIAADLIPADYVGLDRFDARKKIVADLEALGLVELIEAKTIQMPYGDRSGVVVEPWLTDQWYVNAGELAKPALAAVRDGRTQFVPKTWEKTYFNWMENIQPWCVSRQLWWGHRIPAWYGPEFRDKNGIRAIDFVNKKYFVAESEAEAIAQAEAYYGSLGAVEIFDEERWASGLPQDASAQEIEEAMAKVELLPPTIQLYRDEDVLDTWFSSALWPFATLGWPEGAPPSPVIPAQAGTQDAGGEPLGSRLRGNDAGEGGRQPVTIDPAINPDLARHYPGDVLVTGFDIIFFWVARMMMQGLHFMDEVPFRTVYCHGLVRDAKGAKMSKSKGNTIDPLVLVDKYGADALRFTLTAMESQGRDIKMDEKRVEGYRNFATKLWNAARFCQSNGISGGGALPDATHAVNRWIIGEVAATARALDAAIAAFRFDAYAETIYQFVWNRFCDWYLELTKPLLAEGADAAVAAETRAVTGWALDRILVMLHPVMPFLTEELWHKLGARDGDLIVAAWPDAGGIPTDAAASADVDWLIGLVTEIRSARSELNVPASAKLTLVVGNDGSSTPPWERHLDAIKSAGSH